MSLGNYCTGGAWGGLILAIDLGLSDTAEFNWSSIIFVPFGAEAWMGVQRSLHESQSMTTSGRG